MVQIESELFQRVKARSLPHPTARKFDPLMWKTAASALQAPLERDKQLVEAAIFFGREIASLRARFEEKLLPGLDRRSALLLSIAMANYNYVILGEKAYKKVREDARAIGAVHLGLAGRQTIPTAYPGNQSSPDAAVGIIVDVLPHCLERAIMLPDAGKVDVNFWEMGARLFGIMSVEHSLRDLWHQVLWDGWAFGWRPINYGVLRWTVIWRCYGTYGYGDRR
jgi:hypothetical protein